MLLALLTGIARCAATDLCPSDEAITKALKDVAADEVFALSQQPDYEQALIVSVPVKRISDVVCSDQLPAELPTITCKFTIHYLTYNSYSVARLVNDAGWRIDEVLKVPRRRK